MLTTQPSPLTFADPKSEVEVHIHLCEDSDDGQAQLPPKDNKALYKEQRRNKISEVEVLIDLCEDSDDGDKEESSNQAHLPRKENVPVNKTATEFVVDQEPADEVEVSPDRKRRSVGKGGRSDNIEAPTTLSALFLYLESSNQAYPRGEFVYDLEEAVDVEYLLSMQKKQCGVVEGERSDDG
jgi:hypothetical protein